MAEKSCQQISDSEVKPRTRIFLLDYFFLRRSFFSLFICSSRRRTPALVDSFLHAVEPYKEPGGALRCAPFAGRQAEWLKNHVSRSPEKLNKKK